MISDGLVPQVCGLPPPRDRRRRRWREPHCEMVPSRPSFWGSARSRWRRSTVGACVQGGRAKLPGPREGPREQLVRRRAEQRVRRRTERLVRRIPFTRLNTLQRLRTTGRQVVSAGLVSLYVLVRAERLFDFTVRAAPVLLRSPVWRSSFDVSHVVSSRASGAAQPMGTAARRDAAAERRGALRRRALAIATHIKPYVTSIGHAWNPCRANVPRRFAFGRVG